jgi:hypothetical protein
MRKPSEATRVQIAASILLADISKQGRQAITTVFLGPTDHRDPRVKATCQAGSITVNWDDSLDMIENHAVAAAMVAVSLEWATVENFARRYAMGAPTSGGYVFVEIPGSFERERTHA